MNVMIPFLFAEKQEESSEICRKHVEKRAGS